MKAVQTGTEHTWINTCAHCRETVVCVHRGTFPFCLSALFSLFFSVSLSHALISSDLILVYSRSHVPGSQPRRQAAETTHLSQFSTLGTKDIPGSVPQHGEFLWPFPLSLSFLGVEIQEIAHMSLVFPGRHRCWDESQGAFWYSESSHLPHFWLNTKFTVYIFGVSGNVFK